MKSIQSLLAGLLGLAAALVAGTKKLGHRGQALVSKNLISGVAFALIAIVIVGYVASEIMSGIETEENTFGENIKGKVQEKFPTIFNLLILVVFVAVIVVILRAIGAI